MLREAVTSEPYNFKPKSSERGKVWESIAAYLNSLKAPEFRVTARAVRDRYALLMSRHKIKQREEEKASGIDVPELTELDALLEEIREREKSAEEKSDTLRNERKAKDAKAEEIRQAAPQTIAIRKSDDSGEKPQKAKLRRSSPRVKYLHGIPWSSLEYRWSSMKCYGAAWSIDKVRYSFLLACNNNRRNLLIKQLINLLATCLCLHFLLERKKEKFMLLKSINSA